MFMDLVSHYNGYKLCDSGKQQIRMERFFILRLAPRNTEAVLEVIDGLLHIYTYFVGGVPLDNMIPVLPGQCYHMDGFRVETSQAKHNEMQGKTYDPDLDLAPLMGGRPGHHECDIWGSLESTDYRITTDNGFTISIISGIHLWRDGILRCEDQRSSVVLRQGTMRENGKQVFPEKLAQILV